MRLGRASGVLFKTVHHSVTNKPALGSVLGIAASFPGFRFHLSALRQGFRTFTTWNLHSNMLQKGIVGHLGQIITYAGAPEVAHIELYFWVLSL